MLLTLYNLCLFSIDTCTLLIKSFWLLLVRPIQAFLPVTRKCLDGEIVLVTGSGHGLGRELAIEFARKGAILVLWDINEEGNEDTEREIKKFGGQATAFLCDVSDREMVRRVAEQVNYTIGDVTILVNNAGIIAIQPFINHNYQQIKRIMEVNVMSHFWTISEFLPRMLEMQHGHIVAVSSLAGKLPCSYLVPYGTSKYAISGLMETLSEEMRYLKHSDIHFTTVYPKFVNTGLFKNARFKYEWFHKIDEPEDVAKAVVDGIQCNLKWIYYPQTAEYLSRFLPALPLSIYNLALETADVGLQPQD